MSQPRLSPPRSKVPVSVLLSLAAAALGSGGCAAALHDAASPDDPDPAVAEPETRCVTIERGARGDVRDARIAASFPERAYGAETTTCAGRVGESERLTLIGFDLSAVPEGAEVERASLVLHHASFFGGVIAVHRATAPWEEARVTWASFGEAYDRNVEFTLWTPPVKPFVSTVDLTGLVRDWTLGRAENHGVVLRVSAPEGKVTSASFFTSESPGADERPRLEVCFTAPERGVARGDYR